VSKIGNLSKMALHMPLNWYSSLENAMETTFAL